MDANPILPLTGLAKRKHLGYMAIRVGLGVMFVLHGFPKIVGGAETWIRLGEQVVGPGGPEGFTFTLGLLAAIGEFFGGFALISGFLFRPFCVLLLGTMLGATLYKFDIGSGFNEISHPLKMAIVFFGMLLMGPGKMRAPIDAPEPETAGAGGAAAEDAQPIIEEPVAVVRPLTSEPQPEGAKAEPQSKPQGEPKGPSVMPTGPHLLPRPIAPPPPQSDMEPRVQPPASPPDAETTPTTEPREPAKTAPAAQPDLSKDEVDEALDGWFSDHEKTPLPKRNSEPEPTSQPTPEAQRNAQKYVRQNAQLKPEDNSSE